MERARCRVLLLECWCLRTIVLEFFLVWGRWVEEALVNAAFGVEWQMYVDWRRVVTP